MSVWLWHFLPPGRDRLTSCGRWVVNRVYATSDWDAVTCPLCLHHKPPPSAPEGEEGTP